MEELGSGTEMNENTGCAGPGSDMKVCNLCLIMNLLKRYIMTSKKTLKIHRPL